MSTNNLISLLKDLVKYSYYSQKYCIDDCKGCDGLRGNHAMGCRVAQAEEIIKQFESKSKTDEFDLQEIIG